MSGASRPTARSGRPPTRKTPARKPVTRKPAARKPAARKPAARKPTARKPAARKPAARTPRRRPGTRTLLALLVLLVVALGTMAIGPLQGYTAASDRVDGLEAERQQLRAQVDRLEDRRGRLLDPEEIELLARTELGLVKPGEVPYVVVAPDEDEAQVRPQPAEPPTDEADPWYRQLGDAIARLFATE